MSFQEVFCRHSAFLLGAAALFVGVSVSDANATQICAGAPSNLGGVPSIGISDDCVITNAEQAVTPTTDSTSPPATSIQRLFPQGSVGTITIDQGAGVVNVAGGMLGDTIVTSGGISVDTINNDGFLGSDSQTNSTVNIIQNVPVTINNGTLAGSTRETAVISTFSPVGLTAAIFSGGVPGGAVTGDVTINQGSASSAGSILSHSPVFSAGVTVARTSGDVGINNFQGTISGPSAITVNTSGSISIVNGIDENATGEILSTVENAGAIVIANVFPGDPTLVPTSLSIMNNVGSTIAGFGGNTGSAIFVGELAGGADAGMIVNHGTVTAPGIGFALLRIGGTPGGGVTFTNDGTVNGAVVLGNPLDKFVAQGGIVNGTILAPNGIGQVEVVADTRINGAIASSTGATPGDRSSVDLDLNFGSVTFTSDASLSVSHDPGNAPLNNSVFFSQLSADLRTTQDGTGSVNYLFETDVNQSVGTAGAGLKALNFLSGASLLRTNGASYHVANTTIGSGAKLTLVPDQATTFSTPLRDATVFVRDSDGNLTFAGKTGNNLSGDITVNGTLDLGQGRLNLSAGPAASAGSVTVAAGGTLATTIISDGPNDSRAGQTEATVTGSEGLGQIVNEGTVTIASGARIVPTIAAGATVSDGARYNFITSGGEEGGAAATIGGGILVSSANGVDFGLFRGDSVLINGLASDVYLVANPGAAAGEVLDNLAVNVAAGGIVDRLVEFASPTGQAEGQTLFSELLSIPSSEAIATALTQLSPDTSGGASQGASAAQGASSSAVGGRADVVQASLSGAETGIAAGDTANQPLGIWGQFYGFNAQQDRRRGNEGYSALGGGVVVGVDTKLSEDAVVGAAFSYGQTQIDGRGALSNNRTDVDSYQASLYAVLQGAPWYVQSQVGFAFQEFDSVRSVTVGAISERPTADFGGSVFSAGFSGGYPIDLGDVTITPSASLNYVYTEQAGYTETNAPTTALAVNSNRDESLRSGLATSVSTSFDLDEGGKLVPEVHLGWYHEFQATESNSVASFAFGSTPFVSRGAKPAKDALNVGASVEYASREGLSLSVQYDAEFKDRYLSNVLALRARWEF